MIIKTKNKKFYPPVKLIIAVLMLSLIPFTAGYLFGVAHGWVQCVDLGLNFVKLDNVIDKELIRTAVIRYKQSLGGWAFDPKSPWYIGE